MSVCLSVFLYVCHVFEIFCWENYFGRWVNYFGRWENDFDRWGNNFGMWKNDFVDGPSPSPGDEIWHILANLQPDIIFVKKKLGERNFGSQKFRRKKRNL